MPAIPLSPNDAKALGQRIEAALTAATGGKVEVLQLEPLGGGACQDLFRVELRLAAGPLVGEHRLALRSDARRSLPGSLGRKAEFEVIRLALAAGVKTPAVHWLTPDLVRQGAYAYFMEWST